MKKTVLSLALMILASGAMAQTDKEAAKAAAKALKEAKKAYKKEEVPVGCVIVYNNEIIARAHNTRHKNKSNH